MPSVEKALQRSVKLELLDGENLYMCPRFEFTIFQKFATPVPEVFLDFSPHERAVKGRTGVMKRRERKTSGYLVLESHFHADARVRI